MSESFLCSTNPTFFSLFQGETSWDIVTPYHTTFLTCHFIALLVFLISTATGNLSQVDKLWSILPTIYAWMCAIDSRTLLMATLSTIWSLRLTYNFHRRGGYSWPVWKGEEDYRWEHIRRGSLGGWWTLLTRKWIMMAFNLVFISMYQNWLLLWIASPSLVAWSVARKESLCGEKTSGTAGGTSLSLTVFDYVATLLFLSALIVETIADNQQQTFQTKKYEWKSKNNGTKNKNTDKIHCGATREFVDGFCQSGLFAIVRKPNYAAEQCIWFSYFLFSVAASGDVWNWSAGGILSLVVLFQGSGWLTEEISLSRYPEYQIYQQKVPLYLPMPFNLWFLVFRNNGSKKNV